MNAAIQNHDASASTGERIIRVAIIEDKREIREGLVLLIGDTDGFDCTGSFGSMEDESSVNSHLLLGHPVRSPSTVTAAKQEGVPSLDIPEGKAAVYELCQPAAILPDTCPYGGHITGGREKHLIDCA